MTLPNEFFSGTSIVTLAGASTLVWVITSTVCNLFSNGDTAAIKKWVGFVLSLALGFAELLLNGSTSWVDWLLALANGCLIYLVSVGANTMVGAAARNNQRRQKNIQAGKKVVVHAPDLDFTQYLAGPSRRQRGRLLTGDQPKDILQEVGRLPDVAIETPAKATFEESWFD